MSVDASAAPRVRRWLVALALLSLLGAADAGYLLWLHRHLAADAAGSDGSAFCPAKGCEVVNQGEYAEVRGVPLAAIGLAGYLTILGLSLLATTLGSAHVLRAIVMLSGIGVCVSAYLMYLQLAVIKVICSYCVVSAITMMSILVVTLTLLWKIRPLDQPERPA
jgi:uncharacterized membrane protein